MRRAMSRAAGSANRPPLDAVDALPVGPGSRIVLVGSEVDVGEVNRDPVDLLDADAVFVHELEAQLDAALGQPARRPRLEWDLVGHVGEPTS